MKKMYVLFFVLISIAGLSSAQAQNEGTKIVNEYVRSADDSIHAEAVQDNTVHAKATKARTAVQVQDEDDGGDGGEDGGDELTVFEKVLAWIGEFFTGTGSAFGVVMMIIGVVESLLLLLPTKKPYSIVKAIRELLESFIRDRRSGGGFHEKN